MQAKEKKPRGGAIARGLGAVLAAAAAIFLLTRVSRADEPTCQPSLVQRQRYGFVALSANWQQNYDTAQLNAGWYVDFSAPYHSTTPQGMDRGLLIRIYPGYTVDAGSLAPVIDRYPGATWLISNEPDCIWQDDVLPKEYARIYHDLYTFIKNRDRTGRVAAGGIVQPSPLRLEYLDRVLTAYQARYGESLPVDVWHIHNAILNEVSCSYDPYNCWGAGIPPGIDAPYGEVRDISDNDNITLFKDQIWAFRQWMSDRGYGGYPLIVTEYGILMPGAYGFDVNRVNTFMSATSDFVKAATDPILGDPSDSHRLVQRWAWFSLNAPPWDPDTAPGGFNGNLFDPDTATITDFGQHYQTLTSGFPPLTYVDLSPSAFRAVPADALAGPAQTITRSLGVRIANIGPTGSGSFAVDLTYTGPASGSLQQTIDSLAPLSTQWLTFTLAGLPLGRYDVSVEIDPGGQVAESLECNNAATTTLLAPGYRLTLPVIERLNPPPVNQASPRQAPASDDRHTASAAQDAQGQRPLGSSTWEEYALPTANSYPAEIAVAQDGSLWITERDGNKIARFDPQTLNWDEYEIPTPASEPWGIVLDAAGNVWFAETAANQIGTLDVTDHTFAEYPVPTADSEPWGVTLDSGGAIWFSERAGNQIGKLVPASGTVTEYPLATPGAQPAGVGFYGGWVYFAEAGGDRVGRLNTTTSQVNEGVEVPGSQPQGVALTPSGAAWFTEAGTNRIFLLNTTTLGLGCLVQIKTPDSEPYGLATDGNTLIWFTERAGNKLGLYRHLMCNPSNPPSPDYEVALPTPNSLPTGIAVDGEGCAWYTAPGANQIGRFCLSLNYTYLPLVLRDVAP